MENNKYKKIHNITDNHIFQKPSSKDEILIPSTILNSTKYNVYLRSQNIMYSKKKILIDIYPNKKTLRDVNHFRRKELLEYEKTLIDKLARTNDFTNLNGYKTLKNILRIVNDFLEIKE